jgi:hypothetical protein
MSKFDHEKLDVYQAAIEFVVLVNTIVDSFPRGKAYLSDQLQRASSSISLNIAEGAGEFSKNEKARFYGKTLRHRMCQHFRYLPALKNNRGIKPYQSPRTINKNSLHANQNG